jgi:hypothetical protein
MSLLAIRQSDQRSELKPIERKRNLSVNACLQQLCLLRALGIISLRGIGDLQWLHGLSKKREETKAGSVGISAFGMRSCTKKEQLTRNCCSFGTTERRIAE